MKKRLLSLCAIATVVIATFVFAASLNEGQSSVVTFTKDVAPILYKNCAECHRPTGVAPMALMNYNWTFAKFRKVAIERRFKATKVTPTPDFARHKASRP